MIRTAIHDSAVKRSRVFSWMQKFNAELIRRDALQLPGATRYRLRSRVYDALAVPIKNQLGAEFVMFGSCESGLWTQGSDIDASVVLPSCTDVDQKLKHLKSVKAMIDDQIRSRQVGGHSDLFRASRVILIEHARIPIVSIRDSRGESIVDVSVNNFSGIDNTALIRTWGQIDHRYRQLARLVKQWATQRDINDRVRGTLSTYTLLLLVAHVAQTTHPMRLLPTLTQIQRSLDSKGGNVGRESSFPPGDSSAPPVEAVSPYPLHSALARFSSIDELTSQINGYERFSSSFTVADLLLEFFELFGSGKPTTGIEVIEDEFRTISDPLLLVRCPITRANVNPMTPAAWRKIQEEFQLARDILIQGLASNTSPSQTVARLFEFKYRSSPAASSVARLAARRARRDSRVSFPAGSNSERGETPMGSASGTISATNGGSTTEEVKSNSSEEIVVKPLEIIDGNTLEGRDIKSLEGRDIKPLEGDDLAAQETLAKEALAITLWRPDTIRSKSKSRDRKVAKAATKQPKAQTRERRVSGRKGAVKRQATANEQKNVSAVDNGASSNTLHTEDTTRQCGEQSSPERVEEQRSPVPQSCSMSDADSSSPAKAKARGVQASVKTE